MYGFTKKSEETAKPKKRKEYAEGADTATMKEKFLLCLDKHKGVIASAARQLGIPYQTVMSWKKDDEEFSKKCDMIIEIQIDFVEDALMKLVREGNTQAILYYLRTKGKNRGWGDDKSSKIDLGITSKEFKLEFGEPIEETPTADNNE